MNQPTPHALSAPPDNQVHREQYDATLATKESTVPFLEPRASNAQKEPFKNNFKNPVLFCKACPTGYENIKTGESTCQDKGFKKPEDCNLDQYLNDTDNDPASWQCLECPDGAYCKREGKPGTVSDIRSLAGYWRVPYIDTNGDIWSAGNTTFLRCPFPEDCKGRRRK